VRACPLIGERVAFRAMDRRDGLSAPSVRDGASEQGGVDGVIDHRRRVRRRTAERYDVAPPGR
jgi:hypothetical protein